MVITIKAKSAGVWHVYRSEGLVTNKPAGLIRRCGTICTFYFYSDKDHSTSIENRHEVTSSPRMWPSVVKKIIRSVEART